MKVSIVLSEFLRGHFDQHGQLNRGMMAQIAQDSKIDRHTIRALINNSAKAIKLETLAKLSDYLIEKHGVSADAVPGGLFASDPEHFRETLARCQRLDFCLGKRVALDWKGAEYVMDSDTLLQSELANRIARYDAPPGDDDPQPVRLSHIPRIHTVTAPARHIGHKRSKDIQSAWEVAKRESLDLYSGRLSEGTSQAWIAVGTSKVCPLCDVLMGRAFGVEPFVVDNAADPSERKVPIFTKYRKSDPQPPSCWSGADLSDNMPGTEPGIYYETGDQTWACCPWDALATDAAVVFYRYQRTVGYADVICGGFSSRATRCLRLKMDDVMADLGSPQYESNTLLMGAYVIQFVFDRDDPPHKDLDRREPKDVNVIRLDSSVLERRLNSAD